MPSGTFRFTDASAVGTRTFDLRKGDDFKGGDLKGVAVDSSGQVRAGFNLGSMPVTDATAIWSALVQKDGTILLGTGNEGKVYRVAGRYAMRVAVVANAPLRVPADLLVSFRLFGRSLIGYSLLPHVFGSVNTAIMSRDVP